MSKNMTRKGLALGATLSLAISGLVAAPAQAAVGITLEPKLGTEYTMIEGETFTLNAFGNVEFPSGNASQLRVKVTNKVANGSFDGFAINGTTLAHGYAAGSGNAVIYAGVTPADGDAATIPATEGTQVDVAGTVDATAVMALGESRATFAANSTSVMTSPFTFSFTNATVAEETPEKLEVVVWADVDNDGTIDTGETRSNTVTVTYVDAADVTPSLSVSPALFVGDTDFVVSMTLGAVNEAQLTAADLAILVTNGADVTADASADTAVAGAFAVTLNTAKTRWSTGTITADTALALTGNWSTIKARALFKGSNVAAITDVLGAAAYAATFTVSSRTIDATNTKGEVIFSENSIESGTQTATVRRNTSWQVRLKARDAAATPAAVVGVGTVATVSTSVTLSATKTLSVNGTVYTDDDDLADLEISGVTDSSGYHTVTLATVGFAADDTVTVAWTTQGLTGDQVVSTLKTTSYTAAFAHGSESANDGYDPTIVIGGSHVVNLLVADQWGKAPADGAYSVTLTRAAAVARTTAAAWALNVPVVAGKATATITDNGAGAGSDTVTATLVGGAASGTDTFTLHYATAAAATVTSLTFADNQGTDDSPVQRNSVAMSSWNYYASDAKAEPTADANNIDNGATTWVASDLLLELSGAVTVAAGSGLEGVPVTISAKGVIFEFTDAAGNEIYSRDTITVPSAAGGSFAVNAYSDGKGGSVVITASAAGLTKTTTVVFAANSSVGSFTITTPASTLPGRTADVIVTALDAVGDAAVGASVTLSSTGPGYLINTTGTTLSDGTFATKLLLGSNDTGSAVIKVTMTIAGVATTKTATIVVGSGAAAGTGKVNVGSFNGKLVVYASGLNGKRISWKVGGRWGSAVASSNYAIFNRPTPRAGVTLNVEVFVDGVSTLKKSVVTR
jgi:hypothetical protein